MSNFFVKQTGSLGLLIQSLTNKNKIMKTKFLTFSFTMIVLFTFSACKKNKDETAASKLSLLTGKSWVMTKNEVQFNGGPLMDVFPFFENCEKDNRWIFKADGSVELNEGPAACDNNTPGQVLDELRWAFRDNETKLEIDGEPGVIEQLDQSVLRTSITDPVAGKVVLHFAHP
jgi:hypothetical protein